MRRTLPRLTVLILLVGGCFTAHALLTPDRSAPASPASVEQLASKLAACPELARLVGEQLDAEQGVLSEATIDDLTRRFRDCARHRENLTPADRYRLAYSALKAQVALGG